MKKVLALLLSICMLITVSSALTFAETTDKDFIADYFPEGKPSKPEAPYANYIEDSLGYHNGSSTTDIWFGMPKEIQDLALDVQRLGDEFYSTYNLASGFPEVFTQIDMKIDDGNWMSDGHNWDTYDTYEDYGMNPNSYIAAIFAGCNEDDANKYHCLTQSVMGYYEPDNEEHDFIEPYMTIGENEGGPVYRLDMENHTFYYRVRVGLHIWYEGDEETSLLFSDWSDSTSIGKEGTQKPIEMPEKIDPPVLSQFNLAIDNLGELTVNFFMEIPDSLYAAELYHMITENVNEAYVIDAKVKINDGDWESHYVANASTLTNGYRAIDITEAKADDDFWLKLIILDGKTWELVAESNIIGTKPLAEEMIGDVNEDGKVNTGDAVFILKFAANMIEFTDKQMELGDVNQDGVVNTADSVMILKIVAGMI